MPQEAFAWREVLMVGLAASLLAFAPAVTGIYDLNIDEFYYLACSKRLAAGYTDHPPLAVWILAAVRSVFGESIVALRLVPALAATAVALLTGRLAQRFGAGRWGQVTAALCANLIFPLAIFYSFFSMNALSPVFWVAAALVLVELELEGRPRLWLAYGALTGLAALNKHTDAVFLALLALSFGAFHARTVFRTREVYLGVALAALLVLPHLLWLVGHDWITLDFYRGSIQKNVPTTPTGAIGQQLTTMNPGSVVLLAGSTFFFRGANLRRFGWLLLVCAGLILTFIFSGLSRPDRVAAVYPILFASSVAGWGRVAGRRFARVAVPVLPSLVFLVIAPAALALLPPALAASHAERLGIVPKIEKTGASSPLPQWLADRLGWEQLAVRVHEVAKRQPRAERAAVIGVNYGFAGSLEYYDAKYPVPAVYSFHNSYHAWGPPPESTQVFVLVGIREEQARELFDDVRVERSRLCELCVGDRREPAILVARRPRASVAATWKRARRLL